MHPTTVRFVAILVGASMGCGSDPAQQNQLAVGGTYATAVALVPGQNTCAGVIVADNPTVVSHVPGAAAVSLTHAGTTYQGQVQGTGQFTAGPATVVVNGATHQIALAGQFTLRGFTATATVERTGGGSASCGYQVSWTGTKQGGDNVIP